MAQLGDDCYFFCTSTCVKGSACPFRHVESAKSIKIVCQHWQMGQCTRPMCRYRHSNFEIPVMTAKSAIPCYWENQPSGCSRPTCVYKHIKPRPTPVQQLDTDGNELKAVAPTLPPPETVVKPGTSEFVAPQVKPVVIQPADSEDSNSSPLKKPVDIVGSDKENNVAKLSTTVAIKAMGSEDGEKKDGEKKRDTNIEKTEGDTDEKKAAAVKKEENVTKAAEDPTGEPAPRKKKVIVKKKVKKVLKAAGGKTETNGEPGTTPTGKKMVKKVKGKPATPKAGPAVKKVVKKKVLPKSAPVEKAASTEGVRKSAKDRLGLTAPNRAAVASAPKPMMRKSSPSGSDSDDSVENIKVKSVEEILREKALASMMKKRAPDTKEPQAKAEPPKNNIIKLNRRPAPPPRQPAALPAPKPVRLAARPRTNPRLEQEELDNEESSSEGENEEEEEAKPVAEDSSSSEDDSSSESEDDSEDSSESEPEVRRVIVENDEEEKAARQRAKASLLARQRQDRKVAADKSLHQPATGRIVKEKGKEGNRLLQGALGAALGKKMTKAGSKRTILADTDSDDAFSRVKKRISIRDRLGKSVSKEKPPGIMDRAVGILERAARLMESTESGVHSAGEGSPHKVTPRTIKSYSDGEEEEEEDGSQDLKSIKVKTLEEIKEEKMRKQAGLSASGEMKNLSSVRQRLDMTDGEERKDRQIIVADSQADESSPVKTVEEKKAKRRPWRSQKVKAVKALDIDEDSRTAISEESQSPLRAMDVEEKAKPEPEVEESTFEQLKRRALERKIQKMQQALLEKAADTNDKVTEKEDGNKDAGVVEDEEADGTDGKGSKSRKHKHKHKHKHKKSKAERQIYMPPGMKNSAVALVHPTRQVDDPTAENSNDSTDLPVDGGQARRPVGKKGPHPMAAAWAAGLSVSAKGTVPKRPEVKPLVGGKEPQEKLIQQSTVMQRLTKPAVPKVTSSLNEDIESGVVIKSFSEIMAEKRRRRLELQAKKSGQPAPSAAANESNSPVRAEANKPRVPITPITFDIESPFKDKSQSQGGLSTSPQRPVVSAVNPPAPRQAVVPLSFHKDADRDSSQIPTSKSSPQSKPSDNLLGKKSKKLFKKKKSVDSVSSSVAIEMDISEAAADSVDLLGPSSLDLDDSSLSLSVVEEESDSRKRVLIQQEPVMKVQPAPTLRVEPEKSAVKHRSPSIEHEVPQKKSRLSLDDELNLLDDEDATPVIAQEESFDDLLQDIDDLLA